ncbi:hypothetical protein N0V95_001619 [Ascochyta clinopodiicola]|nr:hypothetical protein N0V95_001619 [Ascochyta clinopodiicola]
MAPRMTMHTESPSGQNENADPFFVVTPPRKKSPSKDTTTPATPKSRSTPLHKRFLQEVTMSPGMPTTPPRTPSKSPKRSQTPVRQTLEVGQNGFYFSIDIPEKKTTPLKTGRVTPSPEKQMKSEGKGGGRVRDILRKNLFGTPTKKTGLERKGGSGSEVKTNPSKDSGNQVAPALGLRTNEGSGCGSSASEESLPSVLTGNVPDKTAREERPAVPVRQVSSQPSVPPVQQTTPSTMANSHRTPKVQYSTPATTSVTPAAPVPDLRKGSASTPSNIGHLMASLSNKSSKVYIMPDVSGVESMPTPLRKMSERLGLNSSHVVRRDNANEDSPTRCATVLNGEQLKSQISALDLRDAATVENDPASKSSSSETNALTVLVAPRETNAALKDDLLAQLIGSRSAVVSPVECSRPSTATTASFPTTPLRPSAPSRAQSFGTPARLRSSMQEDMCKVQETLKRSLGPDFALRSPNSTRPTTPMSPAANIAKPNVSATKNRNSSVQKPTRTVSVVEPTKSDAVSSTQAVPKRQLNTAARKPRPKSMVVGSAKMLETIASQVNSPRERAKLRSSATTPSASGPGPSHPRPGTAAPTSRRPVVATTTLPPPKPPLTVRTTKSAVLRAAAHPKRAAPPPPAAAARPQVQRVAGAEAIAGRVAEWKHEDGQTAAPKHPTRAKSTKAPSKPPSKPAANERTVTTPEPRDPKADSGLGQSYTPPGNPTRLPSPVKSPSKTRLVVPTTPAPKAPKTTARLASNAAKLRTPILAKKTPVNRRIDPNDPNAIRTPSKEIQSSLDRAIDAKIAEDRLRGVGGRL